MYYGFQSLFESGTSTIDNILLDQITHSNLVSHSISCRLKTRTFEELHNNNSAYNFL